MNIKCSASLGVGIGLYKNFIYLDALPTSFARPCRGSTRLCRERVVQEGPTNPGHVGRFVGTCWAPTSPNEWRVRWVVVATSGSLGVRWGMHQKLTIAISELYSMVTLRCGVTRRGPINVPPLDVKPDKVHAPRVDFMALFCLSSINGRKSRRQGVAAGFCRPPVSPLCRMGRCLRGCQTRRPPRLARR